MKKIASRMAMATLLLTSGALAGTARADDPIKIGFLSTFSGPQGQLGQELLDAFNLGLKTTGGTLGGRKVELIQGDDQAKPDVGRQLADKMVESDHIQILTGIVFSNVMLAVAKPTLDAGTFVFSINAGPSQYAGKQCHPHYFNESFQNDMLAEAMGIYLRENNVKHVYLMAPNYPAGKDFLAGLKRAYKGEVAGEVYTAFGQLDYAAEIAQLRAANPGAVFFFYPGGMGINFVKQYAQAGLMDKIKLYGPSFSLDQTILPGIGDAAVGSFASTFWTEDFDNAPSKKFVADFEAAYHRLPSTYASAAYDGVLILDAALKSIGGKIEDKDAFQKALENVKFDSIRGHFKFNTNHYPIMDSYLSEVIKDAKGRPTLKRLELIKAEQGDSYAGDCPMKAQ
ncbi:MAG: ABC transporter substrate-binding protein [Xanthobacteraceae bacterium]